MSTTPTQQLGIIAEEPKQYQVKRELDHIHKAMNDRLYPASLADLKVNYVAADLGTAAAIATALNATNVRLNAILEKLRIAE